jgi:ComF family protein
MSILNDFFHLFYPNLCAGCSKTLVKNEKYICTNCLYHLPRTNFHKTADNPAAQMFWGRVPIVNVTSFYYFKKGSLVQKIMHRIKYKGEKETGKELGRLLGSELLNTDFVNVSAIIPVPLTKERLRIRGYNQSEWIAMGISAVLNKPLITNALYRRKAKSSQTQKNRYDRWLNTDEGFDIQNIETVKDKHVLLVDDIVTTGATLEACANILYNNGVKQISIATLAFTAKNQI